MKTKIIIVLAFFIAVVFGSLSCNIFDSGSSSSGTSPIGGDPSPMGSVGNTFEVPALPGTSDRSIEVTSRSGDVSTITGSAIITDPTYLSIAQALPFIQVDGDRASASQKYRVTKRGIQNVFDDGKFLTIVNYNAKVGDTYKLKRDGHTIERRVTKVSKEDDFLWGFMYIKTIQVEETGTGIPGVSKLKYYANHRFGIVGMDIFFEDGSTQYIYVYSDAYND